MLSSSQVVATGTTVLTSVNTPQASTSTRLVTTCISTRRSTARALPTNGLTANGVDGSKIDDLTVAARSSFTNEDENDRRQHRPIFSTIPTVSATVSKSNSSESNEESKVEDIEKRQVPPGLPENCVRWTVIPSLSSLAATPSTSLKTTTTLSSSVTTIWKAQETVFGDCPSSTPAPTSAGSSVTGASEQSTQAASATPELPASTSSGTWVDELSRFSDRQSLFLTHTEK